MLRQLADISGVLPPTVIDRAPPEIAAKHTATRLAANAPSAQPVPREPGVAPSPTAQPIPSSTGRTADDSGQVRRTQLLEIDCDLERSRLKPIRMITTKIAADPGDFPPECPPADALFEPRSWSQVTYTWKASNLAHKPLYFEQPRSERYGHALPPPFQAITSAGVFFATIPILPYKMGLELPGECIYSLGYYRPGSCAPYHLPGFPISARAAAFQTGLIGLSIAVP